MAETVKKGQRITGADRAKLAGELTDKYPTGASTSDQADQSGRSSVLEPTAGSPAAVDVQSDAAE
jgi:hypothetical protein